MASEAIDVLGLAAQDLLDNSVPDPDMLLGSLNVFAVLYFLQQSADYAVRHLTGLLVNDPESGGEDTVDLEAALAAIVTANGNINGACVRVGLFDEQETTT